MYPSFELNEEVAALVQENLKPFVNVPTDNNQPIVTARGGSLLVTHVDLSTNNVCAWGQLPAQIRLYEGIVREAEAELDHPRVARMRIIRDGFAEALNTFEGEEEEFGWLSGLPLDEDDSKSKMLRHVGLALTGAMLDMSEPAQAMLAAFMEEADIQQPDPEMATLFDQWYSLSMRIAVLEETPRAAKTVLSALKREEQARKDAEDLRTLRVRHDQVRSDHQAALSNTRINTTIEVLTALGIQIDEARSATLIELYGEDAVRIIEGVNAAQKNDETAGEGTDELPDWLSEFSPEAEFEIPLGDLTTAQEFEPVVAGEG